MPLVPFSFESIVLLYHDEARHLGLEDTRAIDCSPPRLAGFGFEAGIRDGLYQTRIHTLHVMPTKGTRALLSQHTVYMCGRWMQFYIMLNDEST